MGDYLDTARKQTRDQMQPLKKALIEIALCKHKKRLFEGSNICPDCGAIIAKGDEIL